VHNISRPAHLIYSVVHFASLVEYSRDTSKPVVLKTMSLSDLKLAAKHEGDTRARPTFCTAHLVLSSKC
jgi:hypothetical protein